MDRRGGPPTGLNLRHGIHPDYLSELDTFLTDDSADDVASMVQSLRLWFGDDEWGSFLDLTHLFAAIDRDIAQIEALIAEQLDAILHHPRVQQLEASWRGVHWLTQQFDPLEDDIRLRLIHWTWVELARDLENALEFDQSYFFTKVYSEGLDTPGAPPFGVLIGDYYVHQRRRMGMVDDVATLSKAAEVASAAFCPFILGCQPLMFGLDRFSELTTPSELASAFDAQTDDDNRRWQDFRAKPEARFIGVTLPRILMRLPHGHEVSHADALGYCEQVTGAGLERYLWGNASYAFAAVLIRAFRTSGWLADIRGLRQGDLGGGVVMGLCIPEFETDSHSLAMRYATEVSITERRAAELSELGFIPLVQGKNADYAWFFNCPSVQQPRENTSHDPTANINMRMSSMLHYILCASRFGHYIKQIIRDRRIGSVANADDIQRYLSDKFLFNYRETNENASAETKAAAPLRDYDVQVRPIPGRPGHYACTVYLQPHYQFDYVEAKIRLDTELTPPAPSG